MSHGTPPPQTSHTQNFYTSPSPPLSPIVEDTVNVCHVPVATSREIATFTEREKQTKHRICERILETPAKGFAESGPDLVLQLRGMLQAHVDNIVHERLRDQGIRLDLP